MPDQPGAGRDVIWSGRERLPRRTPSPQLLALLALVVVVAVVTVHAVTRRGGTRGPVQVTGVGRPLLGVRAGWELLGLGPGQVVRVRLAQARVTRTAFPGLLSSG